MVRLLLIIGNWKWIGDICSVLGAGNIGRAGGADTNSEEAEEWEDSDIVVGGDGWDKEQPQAAGQRGAEGVCESVCSSVA